MRKIPTLSNEILNTESKPLSSDQQSSLRKQSLTRRQFSKLTIAVSAAVLSGTGLAANVKASGKRPNVLYVFPDQLRRQALGFMDADPVITPNIDRFAAESLVLTDAVSTLPVCSPHRASMLTGKYPIAHGVKMNCRSTADDGNHLHKEERCISDVMADNGYSMGYIGKWHLEPPQAPYVFKPRPSPRGPVWWDEWTPPDRRHGFYFWYSYGCCDEHLTPHYWKRDTPRMEHFTINKWSPEHETDIAVEYIKNPDGKYRAPQKPFALFISYNPPHPPFDQVPDKYLDNYSGKTDQELLVRPNIDTKTKKGAAVSQYSKEYFAAITGIDEQFGRLLDTLRQEGIEDDTIVVFTSDHGEMLASHGLRGKPQPYEEAFGVPFIVRWPGKIAPRKDNLLFNSPDIMPTLLGLTGLHSQIPPAVQGSDFSSSFLTGEGERPKSSYYCNFYVGGSRGVRTEQYTFVILSKSRDINKPFVRLYNNKDDPFQMHNLADEQPKVVAELTTELQKWLDYTGDTWTP